MKKILCFLFIFFVLGIPSTAEQCGYNFECPQVEKKKSALETFFSKFTGIDYVQIRCTELAIEQYIKQKLHNDVTVQIKAESGKALRNGEFEEIKVHADKLSIENYTLTDFNAKTICPYNKILINGSNYQFPYDIAADFSATLTNDDLAAIVSGYIENAVSKYGGLINVSCFLANSKLNIFISSPLLNQNYILTTGLAVSNGNIILTDLNNYANSIYLKKILAVLDAVNPVFYKIKMSSTSYCYINLQTLNVIDDKIYLQGLFIIPKNCGITE